MVLFNYSTKELTAKIVYYGPGLCGKTTNLQYIFDNLPANIHKGKMLSLATKTDRTLFFDFLPIDLGTIRGMRTRLQLYTVPGQVFYNTTRKLVLKGADGLVFVADSQKKMIEANVESFSNLEQNLAEHGLKLAEMPHILQFNKRDLPDVATIEELNGTLNRFNAPIYEAVATTGIGVQDTLKAITRLVLNSLKEKYGESKKMEREAAVSVAAAPALAAAAPAISAPEPPAPARVSAPPRVLEAEPVEIAEAEVVEEASVLEAAESPLAEIAIEEEPVLAAEPEGAVLSVLEEPPALVAEEIPSAAVDSPLEIEELPVDVPIQVGEEISTEAVFDEVSEAAEQGVPDTPLGEPEPIEEAVPITIEEEPLAVEPEIPSEPLPVAAAEPYEVEAVSVEPSSPLTPESFTLKMEGATASAISAETRAMAQGGAREMSLETGAREATFPLKVDLHGQTWRLLVTITVRAEKS